MSGTPGINPKQPLVGQPLDRTEGRLKVSGLARYSADWPIARMAHAVLIESTATRGKIRHVDLAEARKQPGLIGVYDFSSGIRLLSPKGPTPNAKSGNGEWMPLQNPLVHWNGQLIGVAVAETLESATAAAASVRIVYDEETQNTDMMKGIPEATLPKSFFGHDLQFSHGDAEQVLHSQSDDLTVIEATYSTPVEHHNPMEPHATTAVWENGLLTVYDATQGVVATQTMLSTVLGVPAENIKVVSYFLGGGFGCKGFFWPHTAIAAALARKLGRPVKLVLSRPQMFTANGYRSRTLQKVGLAAESNGTLKAIRHFSTTQTSRVDDFIEPCGLVTKMLYATPNLQIGHRLVHLDVGTPTPMRAPGESVGTYAIESAMDELAYALKMDPIELRLRNYAVKDPSNGKVFSGKHLRECYMRGAEAFEWTRRKPEPGSTRDGRYLVGMGMATAAYPANRSPSSAKVSLRPGGRAIVTCATQDIGTGTYTIMTQIAAQALGLAPNQVRFELGNTTYPPSPTSGGSQTAASAGNAVLSAANAARDKLIRLAVASPVSPLNGISPENVVMKDGELFVSGTDGKNAGPRVSFADVLQWHHLDSLDVEQHVEGSTRIGAKAKVAGNPSESGGSSFPDTNKYSFHSFGAAFAEVRVDPDLGTVRLNRMVGAYDVGRILNAKTARSQALGGMVWAAGMALMEQTSYDERTGRIVTHNLADYLVPVNADIPPTEVIFTNIPDENIGPLGSRGLGEIPITGMGAAIANAVYHATGKRIRDLPITPDKVIGRDDDKF